VANKWLEALKSKNTPHNTEDDCAHARTTVAPRGGENGRTPENPPAKTAKTPSKNGHTLENVPVKTAKTNGTPTKRVKKKLTPEEEAAEQTRLAEAYPEWIRTASRVGDVLEWVAGIPEVCLDIETYGRLKRDGLLYTRCQVRLILLHHDGTSYFVDCDHVPDELTREILLALKDKPKYLHNALFDIPRLYRRFGVLLDEDVHDTLIASRVARGRVGEEEGQGHPDLPLPGRRPRPRDRDRDPEGHPPQVGRPANGGAPPVRRGRHLPPEGPS
jgi:hypothetical protein